MRKGVPVDKLSDASALSTASLAKKCAGDFCAYEEDEELRIMAADSDINIKSQVRKARNKYKKIIGSFVPLDSEEEKENFNEDENFFSAIEFGILQNPNEEKKIPQKSIELAREEIFAFDKLDESERISIISMAVLISNSAELQKQGRPMVQWPAPLLSWWNRYSTNFSTLNDFCTFF
jgi:hypothetical protein